MLRSLIDRFKKAQGPMPQMRIVVGDLAEEVLDLSMHYATRFKSRIPMWSSESTQDPEGCHGYAAPTPASPPVAPVATSPAARTQKKKEEKTPELEPTPRLAKSLEKPANRKKQAFKVLGILWDAKQRGLAPMSAKGIAAHGEKLGLAIRHENVRKVIRMRLEKHIEVHTEEAGTGSIYRYTISKSGTEYFESTYLD